jgi:hypothetical protein
MRILITYESRYGNTRRIAEQIAAGMAGDGVTVCSVHDADPAAVEAVDLLVVGAPTHVHGLPGPRTRRGAVDAAPEKELALEPDPTGAGVREWLERLPAHARGLAAAFDTRVDVSPIVSGRASRGIDRHLRQHGYRAVVEPQSFLVDKETRLLTGEADRARAWGASVKAAALALVPVEGRP